jgi:hypothetical protein
MNFFDDKIGLCQNCLNAQVVSNRRGSKFYLCRLHEKEARFPKYPRLPVLACDGYVPDSNSDGNNEALSAPDEKS